MIRLHLALSPNCRENRSKAYLPLLPDETVASWAARHQGVILSSAPKDNETFGRLIIDLPGLPSNLDGQLQRAARHPDEWLLRPRERTLVCPRCLAEDWARGLPAYHRRAWCVAWRTCCQSHGRLFNTDGGRTPPGWIHLLKRSPVTELVLPIVRCRSYRKPGCLSLGADRRAIHLEAALGGHQGGAWFPNGMTQPTLRAIYRELVSDLLRQMRLPYVGPMDQLPNPGFNDAWNEDRFAINVLAEAILSVWTDTPLPTTALAFRTQLLVRAIGWGEIRPPHVRAGQVLICGPIERSHSLERYSTVLRREHFTRLSDPTSRMHIGYLTLPEARLIGLPWTDTATLLAQLTEQGRFLAFNARRGSLIENRLLPPHERLAPEDVPENVILPAWAYRPPPPPKEVVLSFERHREYGPGSGDARLRRWRREVLRTVRFSATGKGA